MGSVSVSQFFTFLHNQNCQLGHLQPLQQIHETERFFYEVYVGCVEIKTYSFNITKQFGNF